MSDRIHSLTVVLDENIRADDAEPIIDAIRQLRGVLSVSGNVANLSDHVARARAFVELRDKILGVLIDAKP